MRQTINDVRTSLENAPMFKFPARLVGAAVALTLAAAAPAFAQQLELKLMAPAAPSGGWDQTARSMQQALVAAGVARSVQVTNVPAPAAASASRSSSTAPRATATS